VDFYQEARSKGVKPIIGCEVYVAPGARLEKKSSTGGKDVYNHLVLLAKDQVGYKNLVKLTPPRIWRVITTSRASTKKSSTQCKEG
jgi:DNA polymerase III alpha subunit